MDQAVQEYIDDIPAGYRPLFDRLHRVILDACPDAQVVFAYKMPAWPGQPSARRPGTEVTPGA